MSITHTMRIATPDETATEMDRRGRAIERLEARIAHIDGIYMGAIDNLTHHQRQLDADGIEVGVSRQALCEVLDAVNAAHNPQASSGGDRLNDQGHSYRLSTDALDVLMAHGLLAKVGGAYRLSTRDELLADPGSAGVNCNSPEAVLAVVRAVLTSSEPPRQCHTDPLRSGAAEGIEAEAPAPSLKDVILDAARHVRARPADRRGPYVIGDEELDGIIERLGPKSDVENQYTFTVPDGYEAVRDAEGRATGEVRPVAPKPDPAIAELVERLRERTKIAYIGSCKCGECQLVPITLIHQAIAALTASNDRVAELERERDEAREDRNFWEDRENKALLRAIAAEAEVSRLKAGAVTDWQLIESVPKDGRSIAVWLPATATEQPHAFAPVSICEDGTWWDDSTGDQIEPLAATYWAPIHAPSALSNQAGASK